METKNPLKKGEANPVSDRLLKFSDGGLSVDEARAAMLAAKEPVKLRNKAAFVPHYLSGE